MKQVLDHGYVQFIESWGSDQRIVEAARMSTDKGFLGWGPTHTKDCASRDHHPGDIVGCDCPRNAAGDEKLLKYLYSHRHMTPFEMGGMTIVVQAPILVFRARHRTQSYSEMSARYVPLLDINYIPTIERLMMRSDKNKQAQSTGRMLTEELAADFQNALREQYENCQRLYELALESGVPKELARCVLPVGRYSRMMASTDLRNWLGFLTLRMDETAQWEIRQYANAVGELIANCFPRTWELFQA